MTETQTIETADLQGNPPRASQSVAVRKPTAVAVGAPDPLELMKIALQKGAGVEALKELNDLQERMVMFRARQAFENAVADVRAKLPVIEKNRRVKFESARADAKNGKVDYRHEDLAQIAEQVNPVLSEHGLSYRFKSRQTEARVTIICVLSHRDGHVEEAAELSAPNDLSGGKNPAQAVASASTLLQRYTLKLALGLAAAEVDDDGRSAYTDQPLQQASAPRASGAPRASQQQAQPDPNKPHAMGPAFKGETWSQWGERYIAKIKACDTVQEAEAWDRANDVQLNAMNAQKQAVYEEVFNAYSRHLDTLEAKASSAPRQMRTGDPISTGGAQTVVWENETAPSPDTQYEDFLKWVEGKLTNWSTESGNPGDLEEFWTAAVENVRGIFPSDKDNLMSLYRRAEHRVGG